MDKEESASIASSPTGLQMRTAAFVSCDIVGHSKVREQQTQLRRVADINDIVRRSIEESGPEDVVWASGGDGGHVLFCQDNWHQVALNLVVALRCWALQQEVPLRITAHHGNIYEIKGADGRVQPVGDGINTAGWILTRGSPRGIVVSSQFKSELEKLLPTEAEFHDARDLKMDDGVSEQQLVLMSIGDLHSQWAEPQQTDRDLLVRASKKSGWDVIYFAKRIMQLNTLDKQAEGEIQQLDPSNLMYVNHTQDNATKRVNPFLGYLDSRALREVVHLGQLIERRYNEVLCRYGDKGDTMFVILRGQIGVFNPEGVKPANPALPAFVHREGEIVGELAFALERARTADLIALGDTVLLSFNYEEIERRLPRDRAGAEAIQKISRFITSRVLEHTCHKVSYLIGKERTGPLVNPDWPVDSTLQELLYHTGIISYRLHENISLEGLARQSNGDDQSEGAYFLVSGILRSMTNQVKVLKGEDFPLLQINLPGILMGADHRFVVDSPVKILHIEREGIFSLPPTMQSAIFAGIRRELTGRYFYDAFISYNFEDREIVERWQKALKEKDLRIFVDTPQPADRFPSKIEAAVLDSLTFIAFVSSHTMVRPEEQNWVLKELRFRQDYFEDARIIPIRLRGGEPELIAPGYAPIDATANESDAISTVLATISRIRGGQEDPPLRLDRKDNLRLS